MSAEVAAKPILDDLRILDLSIGQAGSIAALLLAEAGADVVKGEVADRVARDGGFAVWNRSKRCIAIDPAAEPALRDRLLAAADILICDGSADERLARGLDDARLARDFPHLIVASVSSWPAGHPLADTPLHDQLVMASGGMLHDQVGVNRDGPVWLRFPLASWGAAYLLAIGVLARLRARDHGSPAGPVRTSLIQGALVPAQFFRQRAEFPDARLETRGRTIKEDLFQCSDGKWIHLMAPPDKIPAMAEGLAALDPAVVAEAERSRPGNPTVPRRGANALIFLTRPLDFWIDEFRRHDIPAMQVEPLGALYRDAQARENFYVVEVEDFARGALTQPGPVIETEPPSRVRHGAHGHDADRATILADWQPKSFAPPTRPAPTHLLEGLKIVDFGAYLAGPIATTLMADLGADVINVEPAAGDPFRWAGWAWMATHRNKRGIAIDLRDPAMRPLMEAMVAGADVVHHNLRIPAATKLGVDYASLARINPALIFTHVSAYGPKGARRDWPGFDQLFQAQSGWEEACAGEGNPPTWIRFGMMDHLAAMASIIATLLALRHRDVHGTGQAVAASLLGAAALTAGEVQARPDGSLTDFAGVDHGQYGVGPGERLFACADGWICLVASPEQLAALGPDLEQRLAATGVTDALASCRGAGAAAVQAMEYYKEPFLASADHRAARLVETLRHCEYGDFDAVGHFWDFGDVATKLDRLAPTLGEDNQQVFAEFGFGPDGRTIVRENAISA